MLVPLRAPERMLVSHETASLGRCCVNKEAYNDTQRQSPSEAHLPYSPDEIPISHSIESREGWAGPKELFSFRQVI